MRALKIIQRKPQKGLQIGVDEPPQTVTTQACDSKNANYAHSMENALHNVYWKGTKMSKKSK